MAHSNPITIGMLAHVDAGKTTLSEAILYSAGSIRKLGRVDNQDTFLDTGDMERARGITIFSKQAAYNYNGSSYTLLDTPGHVDFNYEVSRSLAACDGAILVVAQGMASGRLIQTVKKQLEASGVRVLGAVLNKVRMKKSGYEGGYYGGYYGSYYGNYGEHHEKNA